MVKQCFQFSDETCVVAAGGEDLESLQDVSICAWTLLSLFCNS